VVSAVVGVAVLSFFRPQYFEFFLEHELGPASLALAGALLLAGTLWMWRIANVKY
jgi:Flp pilus assembly protein TadB